LFIGETAPVIYLTFDEGYENGCTGDILDVLKTKGVVATFFVTYDYCVKVPDLVQRMIDEGHTVGNHSYSHPSFPDCTPDQIREEIGKLHDYVKETFEYEMTLIRFPMGEFSQRSLAVAQEMGYTSVFWSFAYMDWNVNNQPEPAAALEKVKAGTHPGAIMLLHAVSPTNAEILGDLVDFWLSEGFRLAIPSNYGGDFIFIAQLS
jgi:peptidoglycan-N-acetylmuramic acid deacetylase